MAPHSPHHDMIASCLLMIIIVHPQPNVFGRSLDPIFEKVYYLFTRRPLLGPKVYGRAYLRIGG
jgi:hypothetical protein